MKHLNFTLPCLNRLLLLTATASVAVFLCGCEKDPDPLYDNGMITGNIQLQSHSSEPVYGNNVRVIAYGPYGTKSTLSDTKGNYTLSGLGNGTYVIDFMKEDFGTIRNQCIQIFGNDTLSINTYLYKKASYKMPELEKSKGSNTVKILSDIHEEYPDQLQIRIFINDTEGVSSKNYVYTEVPYVREDNGIKYLNYDPDPYYPNDGGPVFKKRTKRYMIAYVCSSDDYGYFDEYYGLTIYSTVDKQQHSRVFELQSN